MRPEADAMPPARILIVEDEPIVAWDLTRRLTRLGYTVLGPASSGQEAVVQALALRPDLVLMDIRLPGSLDGIEAAEHIRAEIQTVIVYMTAYADAHTLERARASSPATVMRKPFRGDELQRTVERVLGQV
jgi:CheY-like chemotaxis protein